MTAFAKPSGLPYGIARDEHNPYQDTDFAAHLKGVSVRGRNSLCDWCNDIDFPVFFQYLRGQKEAMISLNRALQNAETCTFCGIVVAAASRREELLRKTTHGEVECLVRSRTMSGVPGLSDAHVYPWMTLCVFVKVSSEGQDEALRPTGASTRTWSNSVVDLGCNFEDPLIVLEHGGDPMMAAEFEQSSSHRTSSRRL